MVGIYYSVQKLLEAVVDHEHLPISRKKIQTSIFHKELLRVTGTSEVPVSHLTLVYGLTLPLAVKLNTDHPS